MMRVEFKRHLKNKSGAFTLIEIMVVIAIIILLSALLVPAVMGTTESYEKMATTNLIGSILTAIKVQRLEDKDYPLPDEQESAVKGDAGYLVGAFRYDRSDVNPGLINRLVNSQKFAFDTDMFLGDDNILIDPWGQRIHYVRGDALNSKNLGAAYDDKLSQDLNKPKDAAKPPLDSDWNPADDAGYPYIYSEGIDGELSTWIYTRD